jgi:galactose mutarotase-like enzyme
MNLEEIRIQHGTVSAVIAPARGALVSSLNVNGGELLYLDRSTLDDATKNVRGGIPVLFPYAGKLTDGIFVAAGTTMNQHGFGRNKVWSVLERKAGTLLAGLESDAETMAVYPYAFSAEQRCTILPSGLLIELLIFNRGAKPMPVSPGWHPYFNCPAATKPAVRCDAPGFVAGSTPNDREFDFGIAAPAAGRATVDGLPCGSLHVSFDPIMRHLQFWSQPGKDFICVEPFNGPNNTVNTDRRVDIAPGAARTFWMRIEVD